MSCSKFHYVKFLDDIEGEEESNSNQPCKKIRFFLDQDEMASIDSSNSNSTPSESEGTQFCDIIEKLNIEHDEALTENAKLRDENKKLKEQNEKLKLMTFEADTRCDGIKIKMNKNWLWEYIEPILNDRDHMQNYFDQLDDLPDNLEYDIIFKEDMEEFFYENLVGQIQRRLNCLKIFGGIHSGYDIDERICDTIHEFVNEALTADDCFEISIFGGESEEEEELAEQQEEEESEEEEEDSEGDEEEIEV